MTLHDQIQSMKSARNAKVRAWKMANPYAPAIDALQYGRILESEDNVKLAGARAAEHQAQIEDRRIASGYDSDGNRLVDLFGSPVGNDSAARIATFRNLPSSRAIDVPAYNQGRIEDWGYQAPRNGGVAPWAGAKSEAANNIIASQDKFDAYAPKIAEMRDSAAFNRHSENQQTEASRDWILERMAANERAMPSDAAPARRESFMDQFRTEPVSDVRGFNPSILVNRKQSKPITY